MEPKPEPAADTRPARAAAPGARGGVVTLTAERHSYDSDHENATRAGVARRLTGLLGTAFLGEYDSARHGATPHLYFVPSNTLVAAHATQALGIGDERDLFGGVVPQAFVATKAIAHSLLDPGAACPPGWNGTFGERVKQAVLDGFSTFSIEDARRAGTLLLVRCGAVRVKPTRATGGRGQFVVATPDALTRCLDALGAPHIARHGLVLEENLGATATYSVGQVIVGDTVASYHGVQRLTADHAGEQVYGGSDLTVVRGGFDALLALPLRPEVRLAVEQARLFHRAVVEGFAGFFASRINYDVVRGTDAAGGWRSGVLEQSWRLGGATGAEIAALELFRDRPDCARADASSVEVYGDREPPPGAAVYFRGIDRQVGPLVKYSLIHQHHADTP